MNSILNPLLAILAIVVPLGFAYVILFLQARKSAYDYRKALAITRDDLRQGGLELTHAEEKNGAR